MWSNGIKIAFFFKTLRKIAQQLEALPPDPNSLRQLQTPVCDAFELQYASLLKHVFQFRHFYILTIGLIQGFLTGGKFTPLG